MTDTADAYDAVLAAVLAELDEADAVTVALYDEADAALWAGLNPDDVYDSRTDTG